MFTPLSPIPAASLQTGAPPASRSLDARLAFPADPARDQASDAAGLHHLPEPRDLARSSDFGYPLHGSSAAEAFLDRLTGEPSAGRAARRARSATEPSGIAVDHFHQPKARTVQTYAHLLLHGSHAAAADYRNAVVTSFAARSTDEAQRIAAWLDNVATLVNRGRELMDLVTREAGNDIRPFARAEVQHQIDRGLTILRHSPHVPPFTATVASVLRDAQAERTRRLAEIDTFYTQALVGGSILGVPQRKHHNTFWLLDGRLIFHRLDEALLMAPRAVLVGQFNYWPTSIRTITEYQYGPVDFTGPMPVSIEYIDPYFPRRWWNLGDSAITVIQPVPARSGDHADDRYRLGQDEPKPYPVTTTELELRKLDWYAKLHAGADLALNSR